MKRGMRRREFFERMGYIAATSSSLWLTPKEMDWLKPSKWPVLSGWPLISSGLSIKGKIAISPFDYQGVKLLASRWQRQYASARDYYLSLSDDDILCGFRRAAGLPAPGKPLGGWASRDSSVVFGQWLQAMA
ncbi:MAG: glycoside hydrolase family 127 protein, partial [Candidatus Aminicenantes bacterium]|nr:glycoside hydrolase family 127 protein [Candidatus Aminicenantes bacterium]